MNLSYLYINDWVILFFLLILPISSFTQIDCRNEQIELIKLDLIPSLQKRSSIQIECNSSEIILTFELYDGVKVLKKKGIKVNSLKYQGFKKNILPLDIISMTSHENPYLLDGLMAEVTFMDRYGNFNRFQNHIPMKKIRNLYLVKQIISLAENTINDKKIKEYFKEIRKTYLNY